MANSYLVNVSSNQDPAVRSTVQLFTLGTSAWDQKGNRFRYLQGVASTVKGSLVAMSNGGITTLVTTVLYAAGIGATMVVACSASVANEYGWYLQEYTRDADVQWGIRVPGAVVVGAQITTTAVAGEVDDAAGTKLIGIRCEVDPTAGGLATGFSWCNITTKATTG